MALFTILTLALAHCCLSLATQPENGPKMMALLKQLTSQMVAHSEAQDQHRAKHQLLEFMCKIVETPESQMEGHSSDLLSGLHKLCTTYREHGSLAHLDEELCAKMDFLAEQNGGREGLVRKIGAQIGVQANKESGAEMVQLEAQILQSLGSKGDSVGRMLSAVWTEQLSPVLLDSTGACSHGPSLARPHRRLRRDGADAVFAIIVVLFFGYMCLAFPILLPIVVCFVACVMNRGNGGGVHVGPFQ